VKTNAAWVSVELFDNIPSYFAGMCHV